MGEWWNRIQKNQIGKRGVVAFNVVLPFTSGLVLHVVGEASPPHYYNAELDGTIQVIQSYSPVVIIAIS